MMRTKKDSERKRKKLVRTGSKGFIARLNKGCTVRVSFKNWVDYWASVQDPNRERYQAELDERNRQIEYLESQLNLSELFRDRVNAKLIQEQNKNVKLEREHEEHLVKISQLRDLLIAVLTPWADSLGPRKLKDFIEEQLAALDIKVPFKVSNDVVIDVFCAMVHFLEQDKSGDNPNTPLNKAFDVLLDKIGKVG